MPLWFAAALGLLQGLTEFLPVSSTAHLRLLPALLGQADAGASYTAVIQLGTLVAVLAYFARDVFVELPRAMLRGGPQRRLLWLLVVGTVPIGILGVLLRDVIVGDARSLYVVAAALAGVAAVMWWVDAKAEARQGHTPLEELAIRDALLIGLAQAAALVPGVSRSGATICMALLVGMSRRESARFSFLLSIPAIAAAGVFEAGDAVRALGADAAPALVIGTVVAAISGYASIAWLMRWLSQRRLRVFAIYRLLLAGILLVLLGAGVIHAH